MTKAKKVAVEKYPKRKDGQTRGYVCDDNDIRRIYSQGYRRAEKELGWHSVKESLPPIDEEVIVLTDILSENSISIGFGKIAFGHRPNPKGWDGKDIATGKVTHYDVVTYDGWNIPGVKYWMPFPKIPKL